jgi:ribosomal-protein-alanine N-acetyltransferase
MKLPFPVLQTAHLQLRQIVPGDADALFAIHADADAMRWYGIDPITTHAEAIRLAELFAAWYTANTGFRWGLERRQDNRLIGTCGLFRWNKSWHSCIVNYELARDCRQQGYMREALDAVIAYGFNEMLLHRVQAESHPDNAPSIGLLKRLGFRFEGVHREQAFWAGQFHDLHCYSLIRREWDATV